MTKLYHYPRAPMSATRTYCGATEGYVDAARANCRACFDAAAAEREAAAVDAQAQGRDRMLGMWRSAVATVTEAARREAEARTGRLDEGKAPSPVVDDPLATVPGKRGLA